MPSTCIVCKKTLSTKTKSVSMYRFPKDLAKRSQWLSALHFGKRSQWLSALHLTEESIKEHHRVCSRHFPSGDGTQIHAKEVMGSGSSSSAFPSLGGCESCAGHNATRACNNPDT